MIYDRLEIGILDRSVSDGRISPMSEVENRTLELLSAIRREQDATRRDVRDLGRGFRSLSENVSRQGTRVENAISDLRQELETTVRIEVSGSIAGMETRLEDRQMSTIEDLQREVESLKKKLESSSS